VSFISHIPGMTLLAPSSYNSLCDMLSFAERHSGPVAIRYPNSKEPDLSGFTPVSDGAGCRILVDFDTSKTPEHIFITYGGLTSRVCSAAELLRHEGMRVGVILVEMLKPFAPTASLLMPILSSASKVVFAEEGISCGGAAENIRTQLIRDGFDIGKTDYRISAIDDNFASPTEPCDLYDYVGLSADKLADTMKK
jgi:1-deoxy-D-xylulose-5-phosphate synthase